ncbi:unnamed protein product [Adineta steineri]|uniref:RNA (guanine-9-)-methyltransferase domain-containing protein 1 n=1 Tax=Adineta steineri TaxID=433720 RepID=A0A813YPV6_9BILA|nr:unnamed protein product [Adineta steineri]CAF0884131.1 unnamed protein product [Adineta steineri]CAF0887617.1 unnamed protein product [Adineta steineri]
MFRTVSPLANFIFRSNTLLYHYRNLANLTSPKSIQDTNQSSSIKENNEWLWEYLRHRQSYQSLNNEQKRQVILLEIQTLRESGERVPDNVPEEYWPELVSSPLLNNRKSIYNYLFVREVSKRKRIAEKAAVQERRIKNAERHVELAEAGLPLSNYPGYHSMFRQISGGHTERYLRDNKLIVQARLNEHVLVDCGYEVDHARSKYTSKLVDQIEFFFANIHAYHSPSFVTLCNFATDGQLQQEFSRRQSQKRSINCFQTTEANYLDLVDKENLIYLSPHSPYEMSEYNHNAVYIIGAIIDTGLGGRPISLAKAKRDNIKHQRLPLERYLKFGSNANRSLSLDKIYNILMALKHGHSWADAFQAIPDRKVAERFKQPRLGRNESERWGKWAGIRKDSV